MVITMAWIINPAKARYFIIGSQNSSKVQYFKSAKAAPNVDKTMITFVGDPPK